MDLEADLWVGAIVRVIAGKFTGVEGVVLRSGNGWVQIDTNMFGEIAKRAHELEVLRAGPPQHQHHQPPPHQQPGMDVFGTHPAHMNAAMQMKRSRAEMESAMFDGVHDDYASGGMRAPMRMVAPRPRPSSPSEDMGGTAGHWPPRQNMNMMAAGPMGMAGPPGMGAMPSASAYPAAPGMPPSVRASPGMMAAPSPQQPQQQQHAPLIHPNLKEAQYQYMQKYLKKMKERFKSRPDMRFWSNVLRSSHLMSGGEPDPYLDAHMAREFNDAVCPSCLCERWPLSKYCWNESCPASPVYWKLTGRPPVPPQFGPAAIAGAAELQVPDGPIVDIGNYSHLLNARRHQAPPKPNRVVDMYMNQPGIVLPTDPPGAPGAAADPKADAAYNPQGGPLSDSARRSLYSQTVDPSAKICGDNWGVDGGDCPGNDSRVRDKDADADAESLGSSDHSTGALQTGADGTKGDDTAAALADMKNSVDPAAALSMESSSSSGPSSSSMQLQQQQQHSQAPPQQAMHQGVGAGGAYMDNPSSGMGKYGQPTAYPMANRGGFMYGQGNGAGMYPGGMGLPGGGGGGPMPGGMFGGGGPGGAHFMVPCGMGPMGDFGGMGQGFHPQQGRFPGGGMMNPAAAAAAMNRAAAMGGPHMGMNGPMGQVNGNNPQFYGRNQQQLPFYGAPPGAIMHMHSGGYGAPPGGMPGGGNIRLPPHYMHQHQQSQSQMPPSMMMQQGAHPGMGGHGPASPYGSGGNGSPSASMGSSSSSSQQQQQHEQQMQAAQSAQRESSGGPN
jgi:hypothetical protein